MDGQIHYLNTDLDLSSLTELTPLTEALEARGVRPVNPPSQWDDGHWGCVLEITAEVEPDEPEQTLRVMLAAIEALLGPEGDAQAAELWRACTLREFNIGYDCGREPWAFNQGLSNETLRRIVACGATLRWTIYPDRD